MQYFNGRTENESENISKQKIRLKVNNQSFTLNFDAEKESKNDREKQPHKNATNLVKEELIKEKIKK